MMLAGEREIIMQKIWNLAFKPTYETSLGCKLLRGTKEMLPVKEKTGIIKSLTTIILRKKPEAIKPLPMSKTNPGLNLRKTILSSFIPERVELVIGSIVNRPDFYERSADEFVERVGEENQQKIVDHVYQILLKDIPTSVDLAVKGFQSAKEAESLTSGNFLYLAELLGEEKQAWSDLRDHLEAPKKDSREIALDILQIRYLLSRIEFFIPSRGNTQTITNALMAIGRRAYEDMLQ